MNKILAIEDLKDSKLLYNKDVPRLGYALLLVVFTIIIATIIWANTAQKAYIVSGSGILQGGNKSYICTEIGGRISSVNTSEGDSVAAGDSIATIKSNDAEIQLNQLQNQRDNYSSTAYSYGELAKSIKDGNLYLANNSANKLYVSQYYAYQQKLSQMTINVNEYKKLGYSDTEINEAVKSNEAARSELYYEAIASAAQSQSQYQMEVNNLDSQIEALKTGAANYELKASKSGVVHFLADFSNDTYVQVGTPIASITEESGNDALIKVSVNAGDRARINVGDEAKVAVAGLQQNVYGTLHGKVTRIDSDISTSQDGQFAYFNVEIKPERTYLKSKNGSIINITNGMPVEARIVYDKITYWDYFLNAIGIKVI